MMSAKLSCPEDFKKLIPALKSDVLAETAREIYIARYGEALADRIRECEVCAAIFWAHRSESATCSAKCFNVLKQRKARKRKKDAQTPAVKSSSAERFPAD